MSRPPDPGHPRAVPAESAARAHQAERKGRRSFTRSELESFRDLPVDDLIGDGVRLLFVGINPGLWTAATNTHFAHPGNRFYPALLRAGLIEDPVDAAAGLPQAQRSDLLARGLGFTNLVNRSTARADELSQNELAAGGLRLVATARRWRPAVVAIAGITAYRAAFHERKAKAGRQPRDLEGAQLWVVPNPSGLNAHDTVDTLASAYRAAGVAGVAAGLIEPD